MKEGIKQLAIFFLLFGLCFLLSYVLVVLGGLNSDYFIRTIVDNVSILGVQQYLLIFVYLGYFTLSMLLPFLSNRAKTNRAKQK